MKKESFPTTDELTFYQRSASRRINLPQYKLHIYVERRSLETETRETPVFVLLKSGGYRNIGVPHKHFSFHGLGSYAATYSLKQTVSNHNEQTALSRVYSKIDSSNKALLIRHLLVFPVAVKLKRDE